MISCLPTYLLLHTSEIMVGVAPQNRKQLYIGLVVSREIRTAEMYMDFTSHWG